MLLPSVLRSLLLLSVVQESLGTQLQEDPMKISSPSLIRKESSDSQHPIHQDHSGLESGHEQYFHISSSGEVRHQPHHHPHHSSSVGASSGSGSGDGECASHSTCGNGRFCNTGGTCQSCEHCINSPTPTSISGSCAVCSGPCNIHADCEFAEFCDVHHSCQVCDDCTAWMSAGIVVKVMHQDLAGGKYYRKKGKVEKVHDRFTADVRMADDKALVRLDQEMLETVIPQVGKAVRLVKGTHKGSRAVMRAVDMEGFCVTVELEDGNEMGGLGYDEVCKIDE